MRLVNRAPRKARPDIRYKADNHEQYTTVHGMQTNRGHIPEARMRESKRRKKTANDSKRDQPEVRWGEGETRNYDQGSQEIPHI
jgi:hypothetical protein